MALKTEVIVSGINNLSDARYCAGMGVDYLGFNIDPENVKYVSPDLLNELRGWVAGVDIVTESESDLISSEYKADFHQISDINNLKQCSDPVFLKLDILDIESNLDFLIENSNRIKNLIVTSSDTTINESHKSSITKISSIIPVMLGFGINENNINEILDSLNIKGIALEGGDEIRPGFKDYDELADILESIEVD